MLQRIFLLAISGSVGIIALLYGVSPQWFSSTFLGLSGEIGSNFSNILRAIMCLYLAFGTFWFISIFNSNIRSIAVLTVGIFTGGVATGRVLSMLLDGKPSTILILYVVMEIGTAALAIWLYRREESK